MPSTTILPTTSILSGSMDDSDMEIENEFHREPDGEYTKGCKYFYSYVIFNTLNATGHLSGVVLYLSLRTDL